MDKEITNINWKSNYWIKEKSKPISDERAKVYYYKGLPENRMYLHSSSTLENAFKGFINRMFDALDMLPSWMRGGFSYSSLKFDTTDNDSAFKTGFVAKYSCSA